MSLFNIKQQEYTCYHVEWNVRSL